MPKYTDPAKEARKYRKYLTELTQTVRATIIGMDAIGKRLAMNPKECGEDLAHLANGLEMANDLARFFGLGIDYRTGKMPKPIPKSASR
jgi:hypothetical protein